MTAGDCRRWNGMQDFDFAQILPKFAKILHKFAEIYPNFAQICQKKANLGRLRIMHCSCVITS